MIKQSHTYTLPYVINYKENSNKCQERKPDYLQRKKDQTDIKLFISNIRRKTTTQQVIQILFHLDGLGSKAVSATYLLLGKVT